MGMTTQESRKSPQPSAKTVSFVAALVFCVMVVMLSIYMLGLLNQTKLALENQQGRIEQLTQESNLLKDQINVLKSSLKEQQDQVDSQRNLMGDIQVKLDDVKKHEEEDRARFDKEIVDLKMNVDALQDQIKSQKDAVAGLKSEAREWQKDYITVLANLEKITKALEEKIKSTRLDLTGKITLIDALLNKLNKMISNPDPAAKPAIIRTRLGNDPLGLQDITYEGRKQPSLSK